MVSSKGRGEKPRAFVAFLLEIFLCPCFSVSSDMAVYNGTLFVTVAWRLRNIAPRYAIDIGRHSHGAL